MNSVLFNTRIVDIILYPDYGLWFLWTLFFINIAFLCTLYISKKSKLPIILTMFGTYVVLRVIAHYAHGYCGTNFIYWHFTFYCIGAIAGRYKDMLEKIKTPMPLIVLPAMCFIVLAQFWYRDYSYAPHYNSIFDIITTSQLYSIITALTGCTTCFLIFASLGSKLNAAFNKLGQMTLGIYAVHQPLIHVATYIPIAYTGWLFHTYTGVVIDTVIILSASILVIKVLETNKVTSLLFLGKF